MNSKYDEEINVFYEEARQKARRIRELYDEMSSRLEHDFIRCPSTELKSSSIENIGRGGGGEGGGLILT